MKKNLAIIMGLIFCLVFASGALADTIDSAYAHVACEVGPNISVADDAAGVEMNVQTGNVSGTFTFRVDANMQYVNIQVAASDLYKANDPQSEVPPIEVLDAAGAVIDPAFGLGGTAAYQTDGDVNGFPGSFFEALTFESSQNGHFSQPVDVTITWDQPDPEKPQGDYSGWVMFTCMMVP